MDVLVHRRVQMCQFVALLYTILTLFSSLFPSLGFAKEPEKTYALLIRGSAEERFKNNEKLASQVFKEKGVPESQITVIDTGVSLDTVEKAISTIGQRIPQDGQLFIYLNSHGSQTGFFGIGSNDSYVVFEESDTTLSRPNELSGRKLDEWITRSIPPAVEVILLVQACQSGNFTSTFLRPNRLIMTTAGNNSSYGCTINGKEWSRFSHQFFSALRGKDPQEKIINADIDQNGVISYKEAYLWAEDNGPLIPPTTFEELALGYADTPQFSVEPASLEEAALGQ